MFRFSYILEALYAVPALKQIGEAYANLTTVAVGKGHVL